MRFPRIKIKKELKLLVLVILAFSAIAFVERKQEQKKIRELNILIHDEGNNYFLGQEEIRRLITSNDADFVVGNDYEEVDLRILEQRVLSNPYVLDTEAFKDLSGNLTIEVSLCNPMARIIRKNAQDSYICTSGRIVSVSDKYTPRVLLISGDFMSKANEGNIASDSVYSKVFELIRYIDQDPFWKAQIAQVDIDMSGNIILYPQVTRQYIEFGSAEDLHDKFLRLKYFYTKILPFKGWNHYARVNVAYEKQIICE